MTDRSFEVVLFGATGFVGALTAAHLTESADRGVRVALAARSRARLEALRDRLPPVAQAWELVEVDATDAAGLRRLAARTRVLATTVGPYARYGRDVVRAAAEEGAHYADLTGEASFVRWSLDELDATARDSGARIVHSCGFDSIPSDLGVLVTAERAAGDEQGSLADATLVVRSLRGGVSGGTIDSLRHEVATPSGRAELSRLPPARREDDTGHWLGPFVMGPYNARVVQLSRRLAGQPDLTYREFSDFGRGPAAPLLARGVRLGVAALTRGLAWAPTRTVLDAVLPKPGEGPSAERRASGRFRIEITATTTTGARYRTTVAADRDPGYGGTAIMLGQSALSLACDGDQLPDRCGVLTPATAIGDALVDRLRNQGFAIVTERLGPE